MGVQASAIQRRCNPTRLPAAASRSCHAARRRQSRSTPVRELSPVEALWGAAHRTLKQVVALSAACATRSLVRDLDARAVFAAEEAVAASNFGMAVALRTGGSAGTQVAVNTATAWPLPICLECRRRYRLRCDTEGSFLVDVLGRAAGIPREWGSSAWSVALVPALPESDAPAPLVSAAVAGVAAVAAVAAVEAAAAVVPEE
jgi:hypothetical protein